jgi:hypothetical protein
MINGDPPPTRLLNLMFWLCLAFALICVAASAVVSIYGPVLFPAHGASSHALGKAAAHR